VPSFSDFLVVLQGQDFFSLLLPFVLATFLLHEGLREVGPLNRLSSAVVALIGGLLTSYFLVQNPFYQSFPPRFFGGLVILLIFLLGGQAVAGFFGLSMRQIFKKPFFAVLLLGALIPIFLSAGGLGPLVFNARIVETSRELLSGFLDVLIETGLAYVLVPVLLFLALTRDTEDSDSTLESLANAFLQD